MVAISLISYKTSAMFSETNSSVMAVDALEITN
jgi:hypothetical protein